MNDEYWLGSWGPPLPHPCGRSSLLHPRRPPRNPSRGRGSPLRAFPGSVGVWVGPGLTGDCRGSEESRRNPPTHRPITTRGSSHPLCTHNTYWREIMGKDQREAKPEQQEE